jgi:paraquat-inducible protein A
MVSFEPAEQKIDISEVIICPDCDILYSNLHVETGEMTCCYRCGHTINAPQKNSIEKTLVYSLTGLILFIPANFLPIMSLNILGTKGSGSIYESVMTFFDSGYFFVAVIIGLTSLVFPLVKLLILFSVSLCLKIKHYPPSLPLLLRWYQHLDEWGMLEVYMVGILISIIKLYHMAHIHYDPGFFCFIGLLIVAISSSTVMDEHLFWERVEKKQK